MQKINMFSSVDASLLKSEAELRQELYLLVYKQETVLRLKFQIHWLKLGD